MSFTARPFEEVAQAREAAGWNTTELFQAVHCGKCGAQVKAGECVMVDWVDVRCWDCWPKDNRYRKSDRASDWMEL